MAMNHIKNAIVSYIHMVNASVYRTDITACSVSTHMLGFFA